MATLRSGLSDVAPRLAWVLSEIVAAGLPARDRKSLLRQAALAALGLPQAVEDGSRPPPPQALAAPRGEGRALRSAVDDGATAVLGALVAALPALHGRARTSLGTALRTPTVRAALSADLLKHVGYLAQAADAFRHITPQLVDSIYDDVCAECEAVVPDASDYGSDELVDAGCGASFASSDADVPCVDLAPINLGAGDEFYQVMTRDEGAQTDLAFHPCAEVVTGALLPLPALPCCACGVSGTNGELQLADGGAIVAAAPGRHPPTSPIPTLSIESHACGTFPVPLLGDLCDAEMAAVGRASSREPSERSCDATASLIDCSSAAATPGPLAAGSPRDSTTSDAAALEAVAAPSSCSASPVAPDYGAVARAAAPAAAPCTCAAATHGLPAFGSPRGSTTSAALASEDVDAPSAFPASPATTDATSSAAPLFSAPRARGRRSIRAPARDRLTASTVAAPPSRDLASTSSRAARRKEALAQDRLTVRSFADALLSVVDAAEFARPVFSAAQFQRQQQRLLKQHADALKDVDDAAFRTVAQRRGAVVDQWLREFALERLP